MWIQCYRNIVSVRCILPKSSHIWGTQWYLFFFFLLISFLSFFMNIIFLGEGGGGGGGFAEEIKLQVSLYT